VAALSGSADRELLVRRLGRAAYEPVWRAMQAFTDARDASTPDQLWLVEHDPVFTQGQAGKPEHLLDAGNIPVIKVDRGGQVTYHGPGQLVAYPLLDLRRLGIGVRELVERIEQAVIDTLATWQIVGERKQGAPGIYVAGAKIMALGLRVRRGCSFHGLALNVHTEPAPWTRINPCGYAGMAVTSVLDCGGPSRLDDIAAVLVPSLAQQFALLPRESDSVDPARIACPAA
jgi:lipoyl(octanoyl) transferase